MKTVTFVHDHENTISFFHDDDHCVAEDLWFTEEERNDFRKSLGSEIRNQRQDCQTQNMLSETFGFAHDETVQQRLDEYVRLAETTRGLEKFLCHSHSSDRRAMKKLAIDTVLSMQTQMQQNSCDCEEIQTILADISIALTHEAAVFAGRIAQADELLLFVDTIMENSYNTRDCKNIDLTYEEKRNSMFLHPFVAKKHNLEADDDDCDSIGKTPLAERTECPDSPRSVIVSTR